MFSCWLAKGSEAEKHNEDDDKDQDKGIHSVPIPTLSQTHSRGSERSANYRSTVMQKL